MLTFLASSGWLALLGVAVPVAIHLWNRRPGRTVAVGSIRWLAAAANRRLRNLKLEQRALLLLRLMVVVLLALAVAGPVWRRPARPQAGQILISPDLLASGTLAVVRPGIDSLRRRGFVLRQLKIGLPRISDTVWQQAGQHLDLADSTPLTADRTASFWLRVSQAADSFPRQPIRVYSSAALRHFQGIRPALPARVHWQTVPLVPTETTWLRAASFSTPDSLRLMAGSSTEEAAYTRSVTVPRPAQSATIAAAGAGLPPLRYTATAAGATLAMSDSGSITVTVQPPLRAWVYYDAAHAPDARYLRAVLRAAAVGLPTRLELTVTGAVPPLTAPLDWLYWLADSPPPAAWQTRVAQGLHLWQDGQRPGTALTTHFTVSPLSQPLRLTRLDTVRIAGAGTRWSTATGQPVLSEQLMGRGVRYHFHSRLNPAWSSLAESPALPQLWLTLLRPALTAMPSPYDQRLLDPTQIRVPQQVRATGSRLSAPRASDTDLRVWLVLAAGLVWGIERVLAARFASLRVASL
ncbi:hypothetical protein GCM10022408_13000 [Hymenobacter fastidiosus]|uniref:Aerotolerance regulator N-terminal domain-containing protein n=1 Tax=Hymenobacter fastidiosus TaxID=486264 RepID=A0ABP7RVM7_9BACT